MICTNVLMILIIESLFDFNIKRKTQIGYIMFHNLYLKVINSVWTQWQRVSEIFLKQTLWSLIYNAWNMVHDSSVI